MIFQRKEKGAKMRVKVFQYSCIFVIFLISLVNIATADITISVQDLDKKILRVTYTIAFDKPGATDAIFPEQGFDFATGKLNVLKVTDFETGTELLHEIVTLPNDTNLKSLKIYFLKPIPEPKGRGRHYEQEVYKVKLTVEAETDKITKDKEGRYVFLFTTAHENSYFILPQGHVLVYCNYPVLVNEEEGQTFIQVKQTGKKNLIFKTRVLK